MPASRRRLIREKVLQALYAYELSNEPIITILEQHLSELKQYNSEFIFAKGLVECAIQHEAEIDAVITSKVEHWEFARIALVDKILLRMGISELLYFPDIPPKVTINEAIEIAKNFSTAKSGTFVNGVLDAIHQDLKKANGLNKTGRGLMDTTTSSPSKHRTPRTPTKHS